MAKVPTEWLKTGQYKSLLLEGLILAVSLPFLLFPDRFFPGTLLALLGLIFIETVPVLLKWRPVQALSPVDMPLLLFCLLLGLSLFITADPDLTLDKASGVLLGLFAWRYLDRFIKSPKQWQLSLGVFGLLGLGFVGLGVLNAGWLNKASVLAPIIARLPNQVVAIPGQASEGIHPNQTAGTALFYFPLLWSVLLGRRRMQPRWLFWLWLGLALLATAVLVLTQSRSGWLGGLGAIFFLILLWAVSMESDSRWRSRLLALTGLLMLAGVVGLLLIGPERLAAFWQDPAQETAIGSFGTLNFRQEVWRWTIVASQDFAFTGIGLGSFRRVIRRLYPLNITPTFEVAHAHNLFLHTAVDIGLPGLISYLAIVGLVLYLGWQVAKRRTAVRSEALGLAVGLIAFHIYGLGDTLALGSKTGLVFWFSLGLMTSLHRLHFQAKTNIKR